MKLSDTAIFIAMATNELSIVSTSEPERTYELGEQITGVTVDLTLGGTFKPLRRATETVAWIDPTKPEDCAQAYEPTIETDKYVLAPGDLVLCITDEHICISKRLTGRLDGKSSLARLGVLVHLTASRIDPGWDGQVVLEILNVGPQHILLTKGMAIGAMSFDEIEGPVRVGYSENSQANYQNQDTILTPGGRNE